jgi:hypothetical protein
MGCQINYLNNDILFLDQIDDAILISQSRRPMAFPFPSQSFVPEALDEPEALRAGNYHDVLPFLISLQDSDRNLREAPDNATMLKYLPHTKYSIYTIFSMSSAQSPESAA